MFSRSDLCLQCFNRLSPYPYRYALFSKSSAKFYSMHAQQFGGSTQVYVAIQIGAHNDLFPQNIIRFEKTPHSLIDEGGFDLI